MEKKNKIIIGILIGVIVILLCLLGYLTYDKFFAKESKSKTPEPEITNNANLKFKYHYMSLVENYDDYANALTNILTYKNIDFNDITLKLESEDSDVFMEGINCTKKQEKKKTISICTGGKTSDYELSTSYFDEATLYASYGDETTQITVIGYTGKQNKIVINSGENQIGKETNEEYLLGMPRRLFIKVDETATLDYDVTYANPDNKKVKLTSDNDKVAEVIDGKIVGHKVGKAIIKAEIVTTDGGDCGCDIGADCDHDDYLVVYVSNNKATFTDVETNKSVSTYIDNLWADDSFNQCSKNACSVTHRVKISLEDKKNYTPTDLKIESVIGYSEITYVSTDSDGNFVYDIKYLRKYYDDKQIDDILQLLFPLGGSGDVIKVTTPDGVLGELIIYTSPERT